MYKLKDVEVDACLIEAADGLGIDVVEAISLYLIRLLEEFGSESPLAGPS